ncbi:hypothetical protein, partial [Thermomonas sp.]|uniref:hypothetical protein n=1 Tax=Thermomonas sp. TaxID=1971895 RepID=UPI00262F6EF5
DDTAVYFGNRSGYTITANGSGWTVRDDSGADGQDTLTGIEFLAFADQIFRFSDSTFSISFSDFVGESVSGVIGSIRNVVHELSAVSFTDTGTSGGTGGQVTSESGTAGNDTYAAKAGNQNYDGGAGIDTAVYLSARASYTVAVNGASITVTSLSGAADGTDQLANVERLQFSDRKLAFDLTPAGHAGQAAEFIGMLAPDTLTNPQIVGMILGYFDAGTSMTALSQLAIDAGLVAQLAGSNSQADLARLVFRNVIGAEADAATVDALVAYMDGRTDDMSRAEFMAAVAGLEVNQAHVNLVGLQATGIEYT